MSRKRLLQRVARMDALPVFPLVRHPNYVRTERHLLMKLWRRILRRSSRAGRELAAYPCHEGTAIRLGYHCRSCVEVPITEIAEGNRQLKLPPVPIPGCVSSGLSSLP